MTSSKPSIRGIQTRLKTTNPEASDAPPLELSHQNPSLKDLFAEISRMNATLQGVASDVTTIKETTAELREAISSVQARLDEAETRISHIEDASNRLTGDAEKMVKRVDEIWNKVEDLENRSRRNNVKIIGLKEGKEAGYNMNEYVQKILSEGLALTGLEFEIERSHRSLGPKPNGDQPPRVVLVKFLRYTAREKVLAAAKKSRGFEWEGCRVSIFEDMSRERAMMRKKFSASKKLLWDREVRHTLAHPATLRFTWQGKKMSFTDHLAAERYIKEHIQLQRSDK